MTALKLQAADPVGLSGTAVVSQREAAARPDALDHWIAEVGEDSVADLVEATRHGVAEGTIPAFSDRTVLPPHLTRTTPDKPA